MHRHCFWRAALPRRGSSSSRGQPTVGVMVLCGQKMGCLPVLKPNESKTIGIESLNFHSCRESLCYISNTIGLLQLFIPVSFIALILMASEVNSAEKHLCPEWWTTVYWDVTLYVHLKRKKMIPTLTNQSFLTVSLMHLSKNYKVLQQKPSQNLSLNETVESLGISHFHVCLP